MSDDRRAGLGDVGCAKWWKAMKKRGEELNGDEKIIGIRARHWRAMTDQSLSADDKEGGADINSCGGCGQQSWPCDAIIAANGWEEELERIQVIREDLHSLQRAALRAKMANEDRGDTSGALVLVYDVAAGKWLARENAQN